MNLVNIRSILTKNSENGNVKDKATQPDDKQYNSNGEQIGV